MGGRKGGHGDKGTRGRGEKEKGTEIHRHGDAGMRGHGEVKQGAEHRTQGVAGVNDETLGP